MKNGWMMTALALALLAPAAARAGFKEEVIANLEDATNKATQLAEAVPADKLSWRPAEGVRSISEAVAHISRGNLLFAKLLGVPTPEALAGDLEKETDKTKVLATLKATTELVKGAITAVPDADLEQAIDFFGRQRTRRALCMTAASHAHEHLGQLIAYARSIGVKPPWSQ
jgi:uncharacterized damage-inducible protein DinB